MRDKKIVPIMNNIYRVLWIGKREIGKGKICYSLSWIGAFCHVLWYNIFNCLADCFGGGML